MLQQQAPSRARHWVVVFAVTLAVLSYIDRVAISKAAPYISQDLGLTKTEMGRVFSAFALSYALAEIPSGWMGDKLGPRNVLMRIVLWWSAFTASVTLMWNGVALAINQFLFGAGEAGCFPNLTKTFTTWLPSNERVRAQGIMWMAARWGGAFTPILCALVFSFLPWRAAFWIFASFGLIWAFFFYRWFRNDPKDHPAVNEAELALLAESRTHSGSHGDVPWGRLISNRSVWFLWIQYFLITYPWYFYITWLSTYIREYYGVKDDMLSARYAIFPLLFGGIGCILSGFLLPHMARWLGSTTRARRVMAVTGFLGASVFLLVCIQQKDPLYGMLAMGMASFCNDLVMPCAWGSCMDIGGKYAGTLSGSMNMMGNLAGFVAPQVGGIILDATRNTATPTGDYNMFIYTMAVAYFLGAFCWPLIDPTKPLDPSEAH